MSYSEWSLTIGTVVTTFSRFGEIKVRIDTDFPERFETLKRVCVRLPSGTANLHKVERVRFHKGHVLLKLEGIETMDQADRKSVV